MNRLQLCHLPTWQNVHVLRHAPLTFVPMFVPVFVRVFVLGFVLVFAQLAAVMHGVGHGVLASARHGATHQHGDGVPVKACDQCMAMAQVQPAPASVPVAMPSAVSAADRFEPAPEGRCPRGTSAYRSRGPPGAA